MKNKKKLLLIFLAIFIICTLSLILVFINGTWFFRKNSSPDGLSTQSKPLSLNSFQPIQGTSIFISTIEQERDWTPNISARWFSFEYGYTVRNLVFLDGNTLSSHTLFDSNDKFIVDIFQFPIPNPNTEPVKVKWLVYEIAQQDTNSDNTVNGKDSFSIAMSDVNGQNYVELIKSINAVHGMDLLENSILLLVYKTNDIYLVSKIDLEQQTIMETQPLTQIPLGEIP